MIRVLVPSVPAIEAAIPYIRRSEEARWYSNWGPNVLELERRLSDHYRGAYVVTVSSCTAGLELAYTLKMIEGYRKIELPALTFPATWLAANRSGLEIVPIDVDPQTWIAPGVSGFGVPSYAPVVDAAAAWGEQDVPIVKAGMIAVFSMHATKTLGCGEGGFIVTWDEGEAEELRRMSNFGIDPADKTSKGPGTNAKMSEYHAAVGLAALDAFSREPWLELDSWYRRYLPARVVQQKRPAGVYPILAVRCPRPAGEVVAAMAASGVECRRWYTPTLDRHPMFAKPGNRAARRAHPVKLPVTHDLAEHLVGLPYHLFLTEADVRRVCEALDAACETESAATRLGAETAATTSAASA